MGKKKSDEEYTKHCLTEEGKKHLLEIRDTPNSPKEKNGSVYNGKGNDEDYDFWKENLSE